MASNKGGGFEREICKLLSLWWTKQERDDVFWRSSQSGGRATMRARRGKGTFGHHGDVASTDPISAPATSVFCWELKRGYTRETATFLDVVESPPLFGTRKVWEEFICQARASAKSSGAEFWLLVQRRDNAHALIFFPFRLVGELERRAGVNSTAWRAPYLEMLLKIRDDEGKPLHLRICGCHLDMFLQVVTPAVVRKLDSSK